MRSITINGISYADRDFFDCSSNNEQLLMQLHSKKQFLEYDLVHESSDRILLESPYSSLVAQQNILFSNGLTSEQNEIVKKAIKLIEKSIEYKYFLLIIN
jgi:hypothetical protein